MKRPRSIFERGLILYAILCRPDIVSLYQCFDIILIKCETATPATAIPIPINTPFLLNFFYTPFLYIRSFAADSMSFILFNWFTSLAPGS